MSYANFMQRLGSAAIDVIIFGLFVSFLAGENQEEPAVAFISLLAAIAITLLLVAILSIRYSGTPGNLLLNCQIVDANTGKQISFKQAIIRSIGLFLTIATFGLGLLWILIDKNNQALHDKLANTYVVSNGMIDTFDESQKSLRQLISEVR